ncbi:MAG TPA: redoxin domain-containing protein [Steroidobacteraceae bacterium]|nr:redoxin domain-containing protein [Steroidobacteraceae bacterium]
MNPDSSGSPETTPGRSRTDGGGAGITAVAVIIASLIGIIGIFDSVAGAALQIGQIAPDFAATNSKGDPVRLSEYRGKTVVLEWTNADCPYTHKHYASGNMQAVQALAQKNGIVWLTVISSAPGKPGYVNGPAADALTQSRSAQPTAVLLDPTGTVARMYDAKTTPHMFVIDKDGALKYMGGIDSMATTSEEDIARAEPYLKEAMLAVAAGQAAPHPVTKPYGCSIKY